MTTSNPTPLHREIKIILERIKSRLETSQKYGPDMPGSKELRIEDAIELINNTIAKINWEEL